MHDKDLLINVFKEKKECCEDKPEACHGELHNEKDLININ